MYGVSIPIIIIVNRLMNKCESKLAVATELQAATRGWSVQDLARP